MPHMPLNRDFLVSLVSSALLFALAAPLGAAQPDAGALELYKARLLQTGSRLRTYPEEAYAQKLEGTAVVTLGVDAKGRLTRLTLEKSSGHRVLDEHAIGMLEKAVPAVEVPINLRNIAFTIQVVVVFAMPAPPSKVG